MIRAAARNSKKDELSNGGVYADPSQLFSSRRALLVLIYPNLSLSSVAGSQRFLVDFRFGALAVGLLGSGLLTAEQMLFCCLLSGFLMLESGL